MIFLLMIDQLKFREIHLFIAFYQTFYEIFDIIQRFHKIFDKNTDLLCI